MCLINNQYEHTVNYLAQILIVFWALCLFSGGYKTGKDAVREAKCRINWGQACKNKGVFGCMCSKKDKEGMFLGKHCWTFSSDGENTEQCISYFTFVFSCKMNVFDQRREEQIIFALVAENI